MGNRILMIEDNAAIAEAVKLNLECADYAVTVFDNGLAARDALEVDHNYDLALLDMMLPGWTALRCSRSCGNMISP